MPPSVTFQNEDNEHENLLKKDDEGESIDDYQEHPPDMKEKKKTCGRIIFNILVGQLIAVGLVSGGIFT